MAHSLASTFSVALTTTNGAARSLSLSKTTVPTGGDYVSGTVATSTSDGTIALGAVGTPGTVNVINRDATNSIDIGSDGTLYPIRLAPGVGASIPWNAAAVHHKSTAATPVLEYFITEA